MKKSDSSRSALQANIADDFPAWYQEVIAKAQLAESGPVRGTMVIRPNGYAIWELIKGALDDSIRELGVQNCYFPLFIPEEYLSREADHVEGFSPELAVVTYGGGKELDDPIVVRPTSETIINASFSRWIQSFRDLPMLINQWANVVRWELRPRLFLRSTEFLWQEGHTAHSSQEEAKRFADNVHEHVYGRVFRDCLAIPTIGGIKTEVERFAGANVSLSHEGMMRDSKALQMATSHELGQNFSRVFDTAFTNQNGEREFVWQTSWGSSTRLVGALIMAHGDEKGLRLPPKVAPTQIVLVQIREDEESTVALNAIAAELRQHKVRVRIDTDFSRPYGRRVIDHEIMGVPLRIELGPRELLLGNCTVVRRQTGQRSSVSFESVVKHCLGLLDEIQSSMLQDALEMRDSRIVAVTDVESAREAARSDHWARVPYVAVAEAERQGELGEGLSVRNLTRDDGSLPLSDEEDGLVAYVAKAY